ncbi:YheC/YheD family protein [Oceanobacillus timonensis]|uniref:YheC/YheD family protein n=1 Tax=Oceanobacillus timonensis TaxID=1926285 RepID=UPI0009BBE79A|nr:YheC/YheD family protein [Oceanobacillus timonensis]
MLVGLMQPFKEPTELAKHITIEAKAKGIDILYMNPSNVNEEDHTALGMMLHENNWEEVAKNIPEIIDVSAFCLKSKEKIKYLQKNAYLTEDGRNRITKETVQKMLEKDPQFQTYAIPTARCKTFSIIKGFLLKYGTVVVKPVYSSPGENIHKVEQVDKDAFVVSHQQSTLRLSLKETFAYFQDMISKHTYIVQQYIPSNTEQGEPFNCRIHLEKNKEGTWTIVKKYVRIGTGQLVSPNSQKSIATFDASMFLKLKFTEEAPAVVDQLDAFALDIAKKIEKTRKKELVTLGLDIGIDKDKNLFLFEANSAPDASLLQEEVAKLRADYYMYLVKQHAEHIPKERT